MLRSWNCAAPAGDRKNVSGPQWDGKSQHYFTWADQQLPCQSIYGREDSGDNAWCASLALANRCVLNLHVPDDGSSPWICISPELIDLTAHQQAHLPLLAANIENESIVVRQIRGDTPAERLLSMVFTPSWRTEVDSPQQLLEHVSTIGQLPVVRGILVFS